MSTRFGWKRGPHGEVLPCPREQALVQLARKLRDKGWSVECIAEELTRRGHRSRAGGAIRKHHVYKWLSRIRRVARPLLPPVPPVAPAAQAQAESPYVREYIEDLQRREYAAQQELDELRRKATPGTAR